MNNGDMPVRGHQSSNYLGGGEYEITHYPGLTKREHFAAMAMQGLASASNSHGEWTHDPQGVAEIAVDYADALLEQLEQERA